MRFSTPTYANYYIFLVFIILIWIGTQLLRQQHYNCWTPTTTTINAVINYDVLLVYVYADTHPNAFGNFKYFLQTAVKENDGVHYYFILQQTANLRRNRSYFPQLPSNAWYVKHENKCFDFGTVGWFLRKHLKETKKRDVKSYKYFIIMNSSVRGPFFTPYYVSLLKADETRYPRTFYWYSMFTQRLNDKVKLVGCTISCYIAPHVQSYLLVTDIIGLSLLMRPENGSDIFACRGKLWQVSVYSEVATSIRIMKNGYLIDSIQTKYQGVDFSQKENTNCTGGISPYFDRAVDGLTLDPYELVFVKFNYKRYKEAADRATVYQKWIQHLNLNN